MTSVGEDMPNQQARARELLTEYHKIGPAGKFGVYMIEQALRRADAALASGDVVEIVKSYQELRGLE